MKNLAEVLGKCKKCGTIANWTVCHLCSAPMESAAEAIAEFNNENKTGEADDEKERHGIALEI